MSSSFCYDDADFAIAINAFSTLVLSLALASKASIFPLVLHHYYTVVKSTFI